MKNKYTIIATVVAVVLIALVFYAPTVAVVVFLTLVVLLAFSQRSPERGVWKMVKDIFTGW